MHSTSRREPRPPPDLVVLERDLFAIPPEEIGEVRVLLTLLDGEVVYEAEP
ncbi:MAG: hypothetical protein GY725_22350 [bacterium]|nr:hypothetical protein [bacterium]